ncbi:hypothetical protein AB0N21_41290 [Streptomyces sp. NPDC051080]|uniref:hypothetical protein n=1 Tax=Streptomyces sp. NPDC051080 TaxID=3157222 RepID=UPI00342B6595
MSSTVPSPADAPFVDVEMPDGQVLRGRLYERRQNPDGWLFRIGVVLWRLVDDDRAGPGEYRAWMPASRAAPVAGADYSVVPTTRLPTDIPAPPVHTVQPPTRWLVIPERYAYDSRLDTLTPP